jgi:hypothetical protein
MCDFHKLILRPWLLVLVGVVFTTETLICLFDVLFRCGPIHCPRNQSSRNLLSIENERTVKNFVQVCCTDKHGTHEEREKKKEWVDSHLAGLEHGQDERG